MSQPFSYDRILYNDVIYWLEQEWKRKLTDHEVNVLIQGYRFGRKVEAENEVTIVDCINKGIYERNLEDDLVAASDYIGENEVVHLKMKGKNPTIIKYRDKRYVMEHFGSGLIKGGKRK